MADWPKSNHNLIDQSLSDRTNLAIKISSLGRSARSNANIKVRQPLKEIIVELSDKSETSIQISDDGPGFPDDVFRIIGEPYISTKSKKLRSKSGLGLGTFIGKTLLERKKALIEFSRSIHGGALVEIIWKNSIKIQSSRLTNMR